MYPSVVIEDNQFQFESFLHHLSMNDRGHTQRIWNISSRVRRTLSIRFPCHFQWPEDNWWWFMCKMMSFLLFQVSNEKRLQVAMKCNINGVNMEIQPSDIFDTINTLDINKRATETIVRGRPHMISDVWVGGSVSECRIWSEMGRRVDSPRSDIRFESPEKNANFLRQNVLISTSVCWEFCS